MERVDQHIENIQEKFIISHFLLCLLYLAVLVISINFSLEDYFGIYSILFLFIMISIFALIPLQRKILQSKIKKEEIKQFYDIAYIFIILAVTILVIITIENKIEYRMLFAAPVVLVALNCQWRAGVFAALILGTFIFAHDFWAGSIALTYEMNFIILAVFCTMAYAVGKITEYNHKLMQELMWEKIFSQNLLDNLPQALIVTNKAGILVTFNHNGKTIIDMPLEKIVGMPEKVLWDYLGVEEHFTKPQPVKNKEIKSRNRYLLVNKTGLYIDNNFVGTITLLNDVTEKREHEEKMKHASTLSVMGELAAATAHEIKNPLTTIQGFIQFFMQQPAKKVCEVNSHLELLLDEIERINKIITDFLKLARPEQPKLAHINTEKLLKNTLQLFEKEATYRNLNLQWKQEENLPEIYGDPDQIKQVLLNLIQNAFQACSSGGQIKFTADSANNSLIVNVEDDGIGISDDVQRKLFQPFFTTKEMGTGLGLPISQRIIEEHGGEIKVDRSSLGGARFTIKLPFHNNNTIKER